MTIRMQNKEGHIEYCKIGFSWICLFFPGIVILFKEVFLSFLGHWFLSAITDGIWRLIIPFIHNKMYLKNKLLKGYRPVAEIDAEYLRQKGYDVTSVEFDNNLKQQTDGQQVFAQN